ncbi:NAD(P)H-dependent flavin oxidoreductase [Thermodesulfobacteriota bacterium]
MANQICELLGIRYPILLGGLWRIGTGSLAAAVSKAGGFGIMGGGGWSRLELQRQIQLVRETTDRPFGVNIPVHSPRASELMDVLAEEKVVAVSTSAGDPVRYTARLKAAGICVMHVVQTVDHALLAQKAGVDVVIAEGCESGGYTGPDEITTFALVPQVVDAIGCPVLAAGGIGDGRGLAAALALGAEGVQMGTQFLATKECEIPEEYKQALIAAKNTDTVMKRFQRAGHRQLKENLLARVLYPDDSSLSDRHSPKFIGEQADIRNRPIPSWSAGQVAGLIQEITTVQQLIEQMMQEAREVSATLRDRLEA